MDAVALVFLAGTVFTYVWAYILWRVLRTLPGNTVLRLMFAFALCAAIGATLVAVLALARLGLLQVPGPYAVVVLAAVLLGLNVPGIMGVLVYRFGTFHDGTD